jgi:hypothetical protein
MNRRLPTFAPQVPYLYGTISTRRSNDFVIARLEAHLLDGGFVLRQDTESLLSPYVDDLRRLVA